MKFGADPVTLSQARLGDAAALDVLLTVCWPEAYRISLGILGSRDAAEDSAQDACAALLTSLGGLRSEHAFYRWFHRIVTNCALQLARRRVASVDVSEYSSAAEAPDVGHLELWDAVWRLPIDLRVAVVLHYYAGLTSRDIAAICGVVASTIRFRLLVARRVLRHTLGDVPPQLPAQSEMRQDVC